MIIDIPKIDILFKNQTTIFDKRQKKWPRVKTRGLNQNQLLRKKIIVY
jgi:hypothetical protein